MKATQIQYWGLVNGDTFAVQLTSNGSPLDSRVTGICGPLHHGEVTEHNRKTGNFEFNAEDIEWIKTQEINSIN